jgi:hypothetical protein
MSRQNVAWHVAALTVLLFGCDGEQGRLQSPLHSPEEADASVEAPRDAGQSPTGSDALRDAAVTSSVIDAAVPTPGSPKGARDAATALPPSKPGLVDSGWDVADSDAGAEPSSPDGGAGAVEPRADGCPEDAPLPIDRVRIFPAAGQAAQLVGARIQGSRSGPTTDFVDLASITVAPVEGVFTELNFANVQLYRYVRYYAPPGSQGGLAEIQLFSGSTRIDGAAFGTAVADPAHPFGLAVDGDTATYFVGAADGGGYVGVDIARGYVTDSVRFTPPNTTTPTALDVTLTTTTADAVIRYTTDGSNPTDTGGAIYAAPIHVDRRTSMRALATSKCRFDSSIASATYTIGTVATPVSQGLKSYHVGNSLTDTINPWLKPIADSTGVDHVYARWTIPGAPIRWLAEHQGEGFEDPAGASRFDSFVQTFAPIDHLSLQPYSDPDFETQGGAAVGLLTTALTYSPNIQFWIYAQWPGKTEWATDAIPNGINTLYPGWQVPSPAANWEQGTENSMLYYEAFRDYVDSRVGGKPFLIVPGGLALVELKREIDAGSVPGYTDFFGSMFEDEVHLTKPAQYLVSLVFYSCLYRQTPENRVTFADTGLTAEQALIFQRIAWDVASSYPGSGISP